MTCNNIVNSTYPSEWTQTRLKYLLKDKITDGPHETPVFKNEGIPFLSVDSIVNGKLIFDECRYISVDDAARYNKKCIPKKGNILMGKAASVGKIALIDTDKYFQIWSPLALLMPNDNSYSKYIKYFLESEIGQMQIDLLSTNNTQKNIAMEDIENIPICVPELYEQKLIADFLDRECGRLDSILDNLREQIETLEKYKESLIYESVTKGLNSSVEFAPSNIDIIGAIPKNWSIKRLKYLCNIITGNKDTIDSVFDGEYPFYVRSPIVERINSYSFDGEAVLMAGDGVGAGKVVHYVNGKFDFHQRVYNIHNFNGIVGKYLFYYIKSIFVKEIEKGSAKTTVDSIRLPMLQNLKVCVPPINEQIKVVEFLDTQIVNIENTINALTKQTNYLENYKKSLIYEYVTGKKRIERSDS